MSRSRAQTPAKRKRRWLAKEVIQTSHMDCGPAALKCILEGYGVSANYERLRESCQTDVDGTSITDLEKAAHALGIRCKQVVSPADQLLSDSSQLPALAVTQIGPGTHLTVVWRYAGPFAQIMDPVQGRRWVRKSRLRNDLYVHEVTLPATKWRKWVESRKQLKNVLVRLNALGIGQEAGAALVSSAAEDPCWKSLAALDAATRFVGALVEAGGVVRGKESHALLVGLYSNSVESTSDLYRVIPEGYWPVVPDKEEPDQLKLRGALFIRVDGLEQPSSTEEASTVVASPAASLRSALEGEAPSPMRTLFALLGGGGIKIPLALTICAFVAVLAGMMELLVLRGIVGLDSTLIEGSQRLAAGAALLVLWLIQLAIDWPFMWMLVRMGRRLEVRVRLALQRKLDELPDAYLRTRPISDMVDRVHQIPLLRQLPLLGGYVVRSLLTLLFYVAGVIYLSPESAVLALLLAGLSMAIPFFARLPLNEADLRVRTHAGALGGFLLDALLGIVPLRTHGAEQAVHREHETLLTQWSRASRALLRIAISSEALQTAVGFGIAAAIVYPHVSGSAATGSVLLLLYWALSIPILARQLTELALRYPRIRSTAVRILEPLNVAGDAGPVTSTGVRNAAPHGRTSSFGGGVNSSGGVDLDLRNVSVSAAGSTILKSVNLRIAPGTHVAVVGRSGAGKSSIMGLLLGWHKASEGEVRVDGEVLDTERLEELRAETAWVDPTVQLWNQPLIDNIGCGIARPPGHPMSWYIEQAELTSVLHTLPDGMQTLLGEGGSLVSGGQGQRIRIARAMLRGSARLVLLDEAFRGLDREVRNRLLQRCRSLWINATLLCITHDITQSLEFSRVLVVDDGAIVEDGDPVQLSRDEGSIFRRLLDAETEVRKELLEVSGWRRLRVEQGRVVSQAPLRHGQEAANRDQ